ncbi:MAG: 5-oxoprolinase subunit PxpB [Faecousia sp.]
METIRFLSCGDCAVTVAFSQEISEETNRKLRYLAAGLERENLRGVRETVSAFCSMTVYYDPLLLSQRRLEKHILRLLASYREGKAAGKRVFRIPVCYEGEYAPDMADVCRLTGLTKEQVIALHSSADYLIYMLGFLPGFPYLGGLEERLSVPRLDSPRTAIPPGAVGIGGKQTGVYPLASPGGWRLIGRTPVKLYDPRRQDPILYRAGDYIRFYPITTEEFDRIPAGSIEMREERE